MEANGALEVTSAIVAETLIEMGVLIISDPSEIHWPNSTISKPLPGNRARKGKKVQKNRHGIFGELVSSLALLYHLQGIKRKLLPHHLLPQVDQNVSKPH